MQLFQLLSNAEFRKAGKKLKEELEKAGVDLGDQVSWEDVIWRSLGFTLCFQELLSAWKNLQKKAGGS